MDRPDLALELWLESASRIARSSSPPTPLQVNLAGSALEAAGIYLESVQSVDAELVRRYADSALQLIEMLGALKQRHSTIVVVAGATAMVEHLARIGGPRDESLRACRRLGTAARRVLGGSVRSREIETPRIPGPTMATASSTTIH